MPYSNPARQRASQLARYYRRRNEFINSRGGKCEKCGSVERLEIDHINPADKALPAAHALHCRDEIRLPELAKCQVLCYVCHKVKTVAEAMTAVHGSQHMYVSGCRCRECRDAHAELARRYRAKKKSQLPL